jgi:hypothetical protein
MVSEQKAREIKRRHSQWLLQRPGVWGVGVERSGEGEPVLVIHLERNMPEARRGLPEELDGCPVVFVEDGPIRALGDEPGG